MAEATTVADQQIVVFRLGGQEFGLDIHLVKEIIRFTGVTPMPNVPEAVLGVINLRGKIIPVVDLHRHLAVPEAGLDAAARVIVVEDANAYVGLRVDGATDVLRVSGDSLEPADAILSGHKVESIEGVFKLDERLIILLDIQDLLSESANLDLHQE